jgi:hypothetical protein
MNEKTVQKACLDLLESLSRQSKQIYATRTNSGMAVINGYRVQLCRPGWPDITACIGGKFVGIEVKKKGGKQSNAQKDAEKAIINAGGVYLLVDEIKVLKDYLNKEVK